MQHYSLVIEKELIKEVDRLIKEHGLYSSRSDFIRDAIRARLLEIKKLVLEEDIGAEEGGEMAEEAFDDLAKQLEEHKYRGVR